MVSTMERRDVGTMSNMHSDEVSADTEICEGDPLCRADEDGDTKPALSTVKLAPPPHQPRQRQHELSAGKSHLRPEDYSATMPENYLEVTTNTEPDDMMTPGECVATISAWQGGGERNPSQNTPRLEEVKLNMLSPCTESFTDFSRRPSLIANRGWQSFDMGLNQTCMKETSMTRCCTCGQIVQDDLVPLKPSSVTSPRATSVTSSVPPRRNSLSPVKEQRLPSPAPRVAALSPTVVVSAPLRPRRLSVPALYNHTLDIDNGVREKVIPQQVLAPPLRDHLIYHAFFLYNDNDRDWALSIMEKLESSTLGFRCCSHDREPMASFSQSHAALYGMKNSLKTAVILSPDFISISWPDLEVLFSDVDAMSLQKDVIAIIISDCDVPRVFLDMPYIEAHSQGWWTALLARLALPDDVAISNEAILDMTSSLISLHSGLQSICLLLSLKSRCSCCGKERVDPTSVPEELLASGVQIPEEEYTEVIKELMLDMKFRCHIWCYNLPLAFVIFTLLLGMCLVLIPLIETRLFFNGYKTGLEFVHGGIVWLCILVAYLVLNQVARKKMKQQTYHSLSKVNTFFVKYNVLVGVENLGLADCNKYYLHFFYFELGSCLDYVQELLINSADYKCDADEGNDPEEQVEIELDCEDHAPATSDQINVLEHANITNASVQTQAADLLLKHSGPYINLLMNKKLDKPSKLRHLKGAYCPCQYVEQKVFKIIL